MRLFAIALMTLLAAAPGWGAAISVARWDYVTLQPGSRLSVEFQTLNLGHDSSYLLNLSFSFGPPAGTPLFDVSLFSDDLSNSVILGRGFAGSAFALSPGVAEEFLSDRKKRAFLVLSGTDQPAGIGIPGQTVRQSVQIAIDRNGRTMSPPIHDVYLDDSPPRSPTAGSEILTEVPEPAVTGLVLLGLSALYGWSRNRRKCGS